MKNHHRQPHFRFRAQEWRACWVSFLLTLLLLSTGLGLYWIDHMAEQQQFGSVQDQYQLSRKEDRIVMAIGRWKKELPLSALEPALPYLQWYEKTLPPSFRLAMRGIYFAKQSWNAWQYTQQQREFDAITAEQ